MKHNSASPKFEIQTRTARINTDKGLSQATVFSAFVFRGLNNFLQTEITSNGIYITVKIGDNNWIDLTSDFNDNKLSFANSDLSLVREDNTLVALFKTIGNTTFSAFTYNDFFSSSVLYVLRCINTVKVIYGDIPVLLMKEDFRCPLVPEILNRGKLKSSSTGRTIDVDSK